jgi:hypothetical protein
MLYRVARDGGVERVESLQVAGLYELVVALELVDFAVPIYYWDEDRVRTWRAAFYVPDRETAILELFRTRPKPQVEAALFLARKFYQDLNAETLRTAFAACAAVVRFQGPPRQAEVCFGRLAFYRYLVRTGRISDG